MNLLARILTLVAHLVLALLLAGCKEQVDLQASLNDEEANEVIAALGADGIPARKRSTKEGVAVSIAENDLPRASVLLHAHGLPRNRKARLGEVFKKEGMISSPMEERARFVYALSQEIEYTLSQIDGVVLARVHVVLPEKPAPGEPLMPSSAAVFIKYRKELDPDLIQSRVRVLVARSIPGIGIGGLDKVSTVFVEAPDDPVRPVETTSALTIAAWAGGAIALLAVLGGVGWWQRARLKSLLNRGKVPAPAT